MELILGDCLEEMKKIPDKSIDLILSDLPYGTTACKWDVIIPFEPLWEQYERVIKKQGAIVLTASQPFTSLLVTSNIALFKYNWIYEKARPGGFVSAKLKPLKNTEDILVFSFGATANGSSRNMKYFPQGVKNGHEWGRPQKYNMKETGYGRESQKLKRKLDGTNYPRQIIKFNNPNNNVLHPTEKPVELMEYLIQTYTSENDLVLDSCMGSGTTGIACINTNRQFIGIEKDPNYFEVAKRRIENHITSD